MGAIAIGIDIGGTFFRIGAVDQESNVLAFEKISSDVLRKGGTSPDLLAQQISNFITGHDFTDVTAIGIGFPAPCNARVGIVCNCPNLKNPEGSFDGVNVAEYLTEKLGIPTYIDKDAPNLLRYELVKHDWRNAGTTIGLYYGTGIGNAVYLNGAMLEGKHGAACDTGHIPVWKSDRYCTCGNRGCIECYAAGHVLVDIWKEHYPNESIDMIFRNHKDDAVLDDFIEGMAIPMATELDIFDPDRFVLGGGVFKMVGFPYERFMDRVYELTRKPFPGRDYEVFMASDDPAAGVVGSAFYAFEREERGRR